MRTTVKRDCYWYKENQDMNATIPRCRLENDLYSCPCDEYDDYECESYIKKEAVDGLVIREQAAKKYLIERQISDDTLELCGIKFKAIGGDKK